MGRAYIVVLAFLFVALIALAVVWWYARRVKQDLDESSRIVAGARGVIELTPASMEQLRQLSSEPILLKQGEEGVRVQIEHRPMMPLMAFVGKGCERRARRDGGRDHGARRRDVGGAGQRRAGRSRHAAAACVTPACRTG